MKALICKCFQCRAVRKYSKKRNRVQTHQIRAARHKVKQMLATLAVEELDSLPEKVVVDYYA
jgi:hypothetical protein